ncbi:MAG: efflux RND transporter periplasmic adaptor subunit [Planctomycetaceae bacterium]|nr:efflux RND transporter periplasmic adaptor subunit [Planctomycetaceae bacterium]
MKSLLVSLTLALGASVLCGCGGQAANALPAPTPPEVIVSRPTTQTVTDYVEYTGRTAAVENVELRAQVSGYLRLINFEAGADVEKGDLLFQIDERPYQASLDAANAEVSRWDAVIKKNESELVRRQELRKNNIIPQEDLEQAIAEVAVSKAERAKVAASVEKATLDLEYTQITAPVTGRVGRPLLTVGNLVVTGNSPQALLTTLVSLDPIYVYFDIDERTLLDYKQRVREKGLPDDQGKVKALNVPVEIGLANETGFPHHGVLEYVDNQVSTTTGTLQARALLDNPDRSLVVGLFTRVRVPVGDAYQAVLVPETAIGTDQGRKYVLVVGEQNKVESRTVALGRRQLDGTRVVKSGLKGDESIVVEGLLRARPMRPVTPKELPVSSSTKPAEPAAPDDSSKTE